MRYVVTIGRSYNRTKLLLPALSPNDVGNIINILAHAIPCIDAWGVELSFNGEDLLTNQDRPAFHLAAHEDSQVFAAMKASQAKYAEDMAEEERKRAEREAKKEAEKAAEEIPIVEAVAA
jgi:hypothetical protein